MNEYDRKKRELEIWEEQLLNKQKMLEKKEMELERREQLLKEREEQLEIKEISGNCNVYSSSNTSASSTNSTSSGTSGNIANTKTSTVTSSSTINTPVKTNTTKKVSKKQVHSQTQDDISLDALAFPQMNQNTSNITQSVPNPHYGPPPQPQKQSFNPYMPQQFMPSQPIQQVPMNHSHQGIQQYQQMQNNQIIQNQMQQSLPMQKQHIQMQQNHQQLQRQPSSSQRQNIPMQQNYQNIPMKGQNVSMPIQHQPKQGNPMNQNQYNPNQKQIQQPINQQQIQKQQQPKRNKELEFEEIKPSYKCEELLDEDLRQIQKEMENERKQEEMIKQQLQKDRNDIIDGNDSIDYFATKKQSQSTKAALSLFGSTKKMEPNSSNQQSNDSQSKQKQRYTMTGTPICNHPGCKKPCSQNLNDFAQCTFCKIAFCEMHKSQLEIIIPSFKNLTSKKQAIKPFVVCSKCKELHNISNETKQPIGKVVDKFEIFKEKRNGVLIEMKQYEEKVETGLGRLITRYQKGKVFSRKEVGKNEICGVCEILMNGSDHLNVTCDICVNKCCVGCSVHTTIAPTLIMGIQDPNAEYIRVVLCKKCHNCTRRKTEDTRIELKKNDQSIVNAHQKLIESETMLKSLLKQLEDTTDRFKTLEDIKLFEQKEMFYVDGLTEVTNVVNQYKKQKDNMDKDKKNVMNNIIIAFSTMIHDITLKHGVIFNRYTAKVKQLTQK